MSWAGAACWASDLSGPEWPHRSQGPLAGAAAHWKAPWTLSSVSGLGLDLAELGQPDKWRMALSRVQVADGCAHLVAGLLHWLEAKGRDGEAEPSANLCGVLPVSSPGTGGRPEGWHGASQWPCRRTPPQASVFLLYARAHARRCSRTRVQDCASEATALLGSVRLGLARGRQLSPGLWCLCSPRFFCLCRKMARREEDEALELGEVAGWPELGKAKLGSFTGRVWSCAQGRGPRAAGRSAPTQQGCPGPAGATQSSLFIPAVWTSSLCQGVALTWLAGKGVLGVLPTTLFPACLTHWAS